MKKLLYIFSLLIATGLFGACSQTNNNTNEEDSTAIRLGLLPTMDCLPFYYADSLGMFDSLGVNIRLITFDAAMDADTAFMNGDIDGIVSDLVKTCLWKTKGDSVFMAMGADMNMWLITAQSARLLKTESIKDRIIGISRHSAEDMFADKILESVKLQSIDLNKPQINNLKLRTLMVDQNQYDGALLPEPFASEAVARGAKRLIGINSLNLPTLMTVLFNDSIAKARKTEVEKIANIYDMAVDAINADTTSMLDFLPKNHSMYLPDTLYTPQKYKHSDMPTDSMTQIVKNWLKGRGLIK